MNTHDIEKYAPIIVPTCNRIHHLKNCIYSLKNCIDADKTMLFISVDYPPNERYRNGYEEVLKFVKEGIEGFKLIKLYIQDKNLGPVDNIAFLVDEVCKYSDCWIFTEDDNEFAPDFLKYMNWGLTRFEKDETVFAVCGFKSCKSINEESVYLSRYFQPYGYGTWINKYQKMLSQKDSVILAKSNYHLREVYKLYKERPYFFHVFVTELIHQRRSVIWKNNLELNPIDAVIQIYLYKTNKRCVFPGKYKSRTKGNDGSGFTMKKEEINVEKVFPFQYVDSDTYKLSKQDDRIISRIENESFKLYHKQLLISDWRKYFLFVIVGMNHGRYQHVKKFFR